MTDNHPRYRLGRRRPDPARASRTLKVRDYLPRSLYPPQSVDHFSKVTDWGMYGNDTWGDCGPTGVANSRKLITAYLAGTEQSPSQEDVYSLYALQNPGFSQDTSQPGGPQDQGVDLQTMCEQLISHGIGSTKALGFASVNVNDLDEIRECITLFGCVLLGVDLENAQQDQTDDGGPWTYKASAEWGGHCVMTGRFTPELTDVITWAEVIGMTGSFDKAQLDEGFVVIWPEHLDLPGFTEHVDLKQLAEDYKALTGRTFPVSTPATNPPGDVPPQADPQAGSLVTDVETDVKDVAADAKTDLDDLFGKIRAAVESEKAPVQTQLDGLKSDAGQLVSDLRGMVEDFASKHGL